MSTTEEAKSTMLRFVGKKICDTQSGELKYWQLHYALELPALKELRPKTDIDKGIVPAILPEIARQLYEKYKKGVLQGESLSVGIGACGYVVNLDCNYLPISRAEPVKLLDLKESVEKIASLYFQGKNYAVPMLHSLAGDVAASRTRIGNRQDEFPSEEEDEEELTIFFKRALNRLIQQIETKWEDTGIECLPFSLPGEILPISLLEQGEPNPKVDKRLAALRNNWSEICNKKVLINHLKKLLNDNTISYADLYDKNPIRNFEHYKDTTFDFSKGIYNVSNGNSVCIITLYEQSKHKANGYTVTKKMFTTNNVTFFNPTKNRVGNAYLRDKSKRIIPVNPNNTKTKISYYPYPLDGKTHIYINTTIVKTLQKCYKEEDEDMKKAGWFLFESTVLHELLHLLLPDLYESQIDDQLPADKKGNDIGKVFEESAYGIDIDTKIFGSAFLNIFQSMRYGKDIANAKTKENVFKRQESLPIKTHNYPNEI